jgi:hypothetical protein
MVYFKVLLLTILLTTTTANSQTRSKPQTAMEIDDKSQVIALTRQLTQLMIDKDTAGLNNILDTHFTLTHITGYVQSKAEWLAEIESERMKYYAYKEVKTAVEINGNNATFTGQNLLDARIWGSRNNWRLQQKMLLEKRNGKWIILTSVATTF